MNRETQTDMVIKEIIQALDNGEKDKHILYDIVEANTGVPRPTIRRCAQRLLAKSKENKDFYGTTGARLKVRIAVLSRQALRGKEKNH